MNLDFQSSFNTSTSFFEKLLYKDLLSDFPSSNTQEDDDTSTVAPESRTTSCRSDLGKNFNPFTLFNAKNELESAKNKLSGFAGTENLKNVSNLTSLQMAQNDAEKPKKKSLKMKNKIAGMLKQNVNENFMERFQDIQVLDQH
jgi:hypothetical protein